MNERRIGAKEDELMLKHAGTYTEVQVIGRSNGVIYYATVNPRDNHIEYAGNDDLNLYRSEDTRNQTKVETPDFTETVQDKIDEIAS